MAKGSKKKPTATPDYVLSEVSELRRLINLHNHQYHTLDDPKILDADFDSLLRRLELLETEWGLLVSDSSSLNVGGSVSEKFSAIAHSLPMLSLDKIFDFKDFYSVSYTHLTLPTTD